MNWPTVLTTSGVTTLLVGILVYVVRQSIASEYAKELEKYKSLLSLQERGKIQSAGLAEFICLRLRPGYAKSDDENAHRLEVQKEYWKLVPWLDVDTLKALSKVLQNWDNPGRAYLQAIVEARRAIWGSRDEVTAEWLWHWPPVPDPHRKTESSASVTQ
jgi:hypothetical protein